MHIVRQTVSSSEFVIPQQSPWSLREAFDFASNGIVILSPDALVTSANSAAEKLLRQAASGLVGKPFPYSFSNGETLEIEQDFDGKKETLRLRSKAIEELGAYKGSLIEICPVTELKVAEAVAERAKEASKLKSDFLAAMSHEIRNPMTGVVGMTSLLLDTPLTEEQQRYVQAIKSSSDVLLAILNDVLDLSKIEAGKLTLEESDFRLGDLIEDTIGLFSEPTRRKGLLLTNLIEPEVPRTLRGDATRIRQVITNLVSNAVKFTAQGRIVVRAFVEQAEDAHYLRVEVSDTGPGLAVEEAKELFKPFEQIRRVMQGVPAGTGLGLALSRQLVEIMNGRIGVDSERGRGSRFWFTIPISRTGQSNNRAWDLAAKSALIVTSSSDMGQLVSGQIKATGANCIVLTPAAAARSLQDADSSWDVMILDAQTEATGGGVRSVPSRLPMLAAAREMPTILLCHNPKAIGIAGSTVEVLPKSALCQSQLCGRVARLLGIKKTDGDAERRSELLAATRMQPISRLNGIPRILVVEDDPINQAVMKMMLERLGFSIDVAANGAEGVDAAAKSSYAAILMDYCLPGLDGVAATRLIRECEQESGRRTPIIATTASASPSISGKCLEAGMDGCLTKPFSIEQLANSLRDHIAASTGTYVDENAIGMLSDLSGAGAGDDFLVEMVNLFVETAPPLFDKLSAAIAARDNVAIEKTAHRLKGSAGHFGARRLTQCLEELENKGHIGDLTDCEALLSRALSEFSQVASILKEQRSSHVA